MKTILLTLITVLILAACAPASPTLEPSNPSPVPPTEVPTLAPTEPPAPTEVITTQPAEVPTESPQVSSDLTTFTIVPGESKVRYEVYETFLNQNNRLNLAIGVTTTINGEIRANMDNPPASEIGTIEVDISQFKSDSNRRDNAIRGNWLESGKFPVAVFEPSKIEGMPTSYVEGQQYTFTVTGNLTVRDVTQEVTFNVSAALNGDTLTGTAETTILLSAFDVGPISIAGILNTEDEAKLVLDFVARR